MTAVLKIVPPDVPLRLIKKGKQTLPRTFYLDGKFYNGRVEEARVYYQTHPEVNEQYTFEEYVHITHYEFQKPVDAIRQELIDLCSQSMDTKDLVKAIFLLNKL